MVPSDLAGKIRAEVRRSRGGFGIAVGFLALAFILFGALMISQPDPVRRLAHVFQLTGIVYFVAALVVHRRRVRAVRFDVDRTTVPSLAAARRYLETRRAFHTGSSLMARIAVLFPGPPIDIYAQVRAGIIPADAGLQSLLIWVALLGAAFLVQRGVARRYDRRLRDLDDLERSSPVERFLAEHEQWKRD